MEFAWGESELANIVHQGDVGVVNGDSEVSLIGQGCAVVIVGFAGRCCTYIRLPKKKKRCAEKRCGQQAGPEEA
jgi:hypothetical protein